MITTTCGKEIDVRHQIVAGGDLLDGQVAELVDWVMRRRVQMRNHDESRGIVRLLQKGLELVSLFLATDTHGHD